MPNNQSSSELAKAWGRAFVPTLIIMAAGFLVTIITFSWSHQSFAFWCCWLLFVVLGTIAFAIWAAASDFTPTWVGALIILALMVASATGLGWAFNSDFFSSWSWTDFGLGILCLSVIGGATGINVFYKYRTRN